MPKKIHVREVSLDDGAVKLRVGTNWFSCGTKCDENGLDPKCIECCNQMQDKLGRWLDTDDAMQPEEKARVRLTLRAGLVPRCEDGECVCAQDPNGLPEPDPIDII